MFGSRNTVGAAIIPATAPRTAARPQPSASIQPTRTPTSLLAVGLIADARVLRRDRDVADLPGGVRKRAVERLHLRAPDPARGAVERDQQTDRDDHDRERRL